MTYVDGFLIPVPKAKLAQYRKMARLGERVWMEHGALDYKECVADDLHSIVPDETGKGTKKVPSLLPKMAGARRGETVVFSYIVFKSRAHRDRVNKKVMSDPRMADFDPADMPVDMKRFGYAGFKAIVESSGRKAPAARHSQRRTQRPRGRTHPRGRVETAWPTGL